MRRSVRDLPLRQKVALLIIATMAAAQLLGGIGMLVWDLINARRVLAADLDTQVRVVVDNVGPALQFEDPDAATETLRGLRQRRGFERACVYDARSQLFAAVNEVGHCSAVPADDGTRFEGAGLEVATPVVVPGRGRVGTLTLHSSLSPVTDAMRAQTVAIVVVMLLSSLAALVLTRRYQRVLTEPLHALATTAEAVSRDRDYTHRVQKTSNDEIGAVAAAFNEMLEQVQRREADLQHALRLKDEFLATVSHELRTPLNAIVGWVHVFRSPNVPAELAAQAADAIDRNAQRQVRLIEDILDVSRIVTGKLRLEPKAVDFAAIIEAALDVVQPTAAAKDIRVTANLVQPAPLRGDPDRLQQIMWNLLSNAVKFTPRGGEVSVRLRETGDHYEAQVQDSGPGIPPDFLPHIFEAFRQADGSMTRTHGGLGLGLAIARHLTELSGGTIEARSEGEGHGATFVVRLPRPAGEVRRLADADEDAAAWQRLDGMRVLLVDDDEDTRKVLSALLQAQGAETTTASSVAEARAALKLAVPDVLITDLAMPVEDGYALVHYCRESPRPELRTLKILALTAYAGEKARESVLRAGFNGHLAKPIDPGAVSRTIKATVVS